jgi:hypothetical protein
MDNGWFLIKPVLLTINSDRICGNLLLNASSEWQSLFEWNYDIKSFSHFECTYTINAPLDYVIQLLNTDFYDVSLVGLTLYDGPSINDTPIDL